MRSRASCATSPASTASAAVRVPTGSTWGRSTPAQPTTDSSLKAVGSPAESPPGVCRGWGVLQVGSLGSPLGPAARRRPARKRRRCSAKASLHGVVGKPCQCQCLHQSHRHEGRVVKNVLWSLIWQSVPALCGSCGRMAKTCMEQSKVLVDAPLRLRAQVRQAARHGSLRGGNALCRAACCLLHARQRALRSSCPRCSLLRRPVKIAGDSGGRSRNEESNLKIAAMLMQAQHGWKLCRK